MKKKPTKKVTAKKAKPTHRVVVTKRTKTAIKKTVKKEAKKTAPKQERQKPILWQPDIPKAKVAKKTSATAEQILREKPKWFRDIVAATPKREPAPNIKHNFIVSSAKVKLVRFRRETDKEYTARVGDAKQQARLTSKGKKLSNKLIAYLLLLNSLSCYADIATLSEMQTAAGHRLRPSRVDKIRKVLRKRSGKMLKYVRALLEKRGVINQEPEETTHAEIEQAISVDAGGGEAGREDPVQPTEVANLG